MATEALRKVLLEAELASHVVRADDGYLSTVVHTNEEAADRALAAMTAAGLRVFRRATEADEALEDW